MAKIALRVYNREIENLIDLGQTDEAIGHCKAILKVYPKHLETYRLLGKAYLESHRYSEALDIFQRVLSVVPDDFLAHIGMSIIREDEGNLDAAIWHMERAFEVQPSNSAIQDELRRLYGRRDGVQPPKIRLTRGALVRMYANGELFAQAIAEARAALSEDPQRVDLEVLLARLYYLSGQQIETTEICSRLINKLPFCYDANKILAEILLSTTKSEDAKIYQERVCALDPYLAMVSPATPTVAQIPDMAVNLDRFDWQASREGSASQPEWASAIGMTLEDEDKITPEWMMPSSNEPVNESTETPAESLENLTPFDDLFKEEAQTQIPAGLVEESQPQSEEAAAEFPDWMRSAGWTTPEEKPAGETISEQQAAFNDAIETEELPDWLKDLTPSSIKNKNEEEQAIPPREEIIQPVEEILQQPEAVEIFEEIKTSGEEGESFSTPPVFEEVQLEETAEGITTLEEVPQNEEAAVLPLAEDELLFEDEITSEEELPDWLKVAPREEIPGEEASAVESSFSEQMLTEGPLETSSVADWLKELGEKELEDERTLDAVVEEDLPEWLRVKVEPEADKLDFLQQGPIETEEGAVPQEIPPVMEEPSSESVAAAIPFEQESKHSDDDATFAWLESLAVKQGVDEQTLLTTAEERDEQADRAILPEIETPALEAEQEIGAESIPEWVTEAAEVEKETIEELPISQEEVAVEAVPEESTATEEAEFSPPAFEQEVAENAPIPEKEEIGFPIDLLTAEEEKISEVSEILSVEEEAVNISEENLLEAAPVEEGTAEVNLLDLARSTFKHGQIDEALEMYRQMIQTGQNINEVIQDLTNDTYSHPVEFSIYQTLGDAYRKNNQFQEALDAYTKAEELF